MMRTRIGRLVGLLTLGIVLAPAVARGQEVPPPSPLFPFPFGSSRYEDGGFYVAGEFLIARQTNPLKPQLLAFRGFVDVDGSITGTPGRFVGSRKPALSVDDLGPGTFEPGLRLTAGWRFQDGVAVEINWKHLSETRYSATASLVPKDFQVGPNLADSFLSSPVYNFPIDYAGPAGDVSVGNPGATFGIWNASDLQTIDFVQRFEQVDLTGRIPLEQTDCWRNYGLIGARAVVMWERFKWRVVDAASNGVADSTDVANYTNVVSNRLYGAHCGWGNEWYWGSSPIGAVSVSLDLDAALLVDIIKERAKYEIGDLHTAASRSRGQYTMAPEVAADLNFWWYPTQGIQLRVGWDVALFFNTVSSPRPVDFNFGAIDPSFERWQTRYFHGLHAGIGFDF